MLLLLAFGALPACGPEADAPTSAIGALAAAPVTPPAPPAPPSPPDAGTCRRFTSCVPQNPCHTGWVTGCRANAPICTDIGGWLSNGTTCGDDQVCYMGDCVPCAAGEACQLYDDQGYPALCRVGAITCDSGQPVCKDVGAAPDGSGCWPGSEPMYVCTNGQCTYCPVGSQCTPEAAPCNKGVWTCGAGSVCEDTGLPADDGTWCGDGRVCHAGACVACRSGQQCQPEGMPCWTGSTDCSTGSAVCQPWSRLPEGSSCGDGLVCDWNGQCVAQCVNGESCTPYWNPCLTGTKVCNGPTSWYCQEGAPAADGTSCGPAQVCMSGSCTACGAGSWCPAPDSCHSSGTISCATGQCEPTGAAYTDGTSCGVGSETCQGGTCTGVPGSAIVVRTLNGAADLTGTSWSVCETDRPQPGWSERRTDTYVLGGILHVEETFAAPGCSGAASSRLEISGSAVTTGDRVVTWAGSYPPDGLWSTMTATGIAISAVHPVTNEPIELKDLRLVNDWIYPRKIYEGENDSALGPDGYPTLLADLQRREVVPCTQGESCPNPYGTCDAWAIDCSAGYPACAPTGEKLPDGSWCAAGVCQGGYCVAGSGVSGFRTITYWPDAGASAPVVPNDVYTIGAYWPDAGGGYYSGSTNWDGSFSVPGVPEGPYVLTFSRGLTYFIETDARWVDLGEDVIGRDGVVRAYEPTPVTISVENLVPWQSADSLQLVCGNTGTAVTTFLGSAIAAGSTSWSGSFDWQNTALLDAARDDVAILLQSSTAPLPGTSLSYRSASRWGQAPPTTLFPGSAFPQALSASLQDVDSVASFTTAWPTATYAQHLAEVNPNATLGLHRLAVVAKPWTAPAVPAGNLPFFLPNAMQLLVARALTTPGDLSVEGASFGRFLPPHWNEYRELRLNASVPVAMPDGTQRTYTGWIVRLDPLASAPPNAEPLVTPPLDPRIQVGGMLVSAFVPQAGVGTGPLLAWSPPATGAPTSYTVTLLSPMTEYPNSYLVAALAMTSRTTFRFPDGLLDPTRSYLAVITARSAETEGLGAPLRMQFDADFAQAITATFTP